MAKSVFVTRRKDIMGSVQLRYLAKHLCDPERWPMNEPVNYKAVVLATQMIAAAAAHDPELGPLVQGMILAGL